MLTVTQADIKNAGGFLSALTIKSAEYVRTVLDIGKKNKPNLQGREKYLQRIIVHRDPHIDEYFAELIFRACLPPTPNTMNLEFMELSIGSKDNDQTCRSLFPTAAVLGIGRAASGGAEALFIFDEHVEEGGKSQPSCSQVVVDKFLKHIPSSVHQVLVEINAIDTYGNAHPQYLGQLIKILSEARFFVEKGRTSKEDKRSFLNPAWKRSLVSSCLCAVIYCLENSINLDSNPKEKENSLQNSLDKYAPNSLHRGHPKFEETHQYISKKYGSGQDVVFGDAILKNRSKTPITDNRRENIPQRLILSRVCYALQQCWGESFAQVIMTHFWEVVFQGQIHFLVIQDELDRAFAQTGDRFITAIGTFERQILPPVQIVDRRQQKKKVPLWIVSFSPNAPDSIRANGPILSYISYHNDGCGMVLLENPFENTKALFRGQTTPEDGWKKLVHLIQSKEEDCWYDPAANPNEVADMLLNGNKAHRYRPRSNIDVVVLAELVKKIFY